MAGAKIDAMRSRRSWAVGLALTAVFLLIGVVAAVSGSTRQAKRSMPRLPVLGPARDVFDGDIGDPFVLPVTAAENGRPGYFVFGTNDWPAHVPTGFSPDLVHWKRGPDALPVLPAWAAPDPTNSLTWAPSVLASGGRYVLYVSVPDAASGRECIGAEVSDRPAGPYHDSGPGPLVCQVELGGSIDPMVLRGRDGGLHLLWKNDGNCCGLPVSLWEQDVASDGLRLSGVAHRLLGADQAWEGGVIERPVAVPAEHGGWWLFFAGNNWQLAAYGTGLAYCPKLSGPCRDAKQGRFLATQANQNSPGGFDTFVDRGGTRWAVYATWSRPPWKGRFFCCRSVELGQLISS